MREHPHECVEPYRTDRGPGTESHRGAQHGMFHIRFNGNVLGVVSSIVRGWEHVGVSLRNRWPTWGEMSYIKGLFFIEDETVVMFHPRECDYKDAHCFRLSLWRPIDGEIALPPVEWVPMADQDQDKQHARDGAAIDAGIAAEQHPDFQRLGAVPGFRSWWAAAKSEGMEFDSGYFFAAGVPHTFGNAISPLVSEIEAIEAFAARERIENDERH